MLEKRENPPYTVGWSILPENGGYAMQIQRLFEIVYILVDRKAITAKELAQHFEVSVRTILRDIDTLTAAGIPLYTSQGKGGGIFILDHYVLSKTVLTEEEQNHLLFALQSMTATQHVDSTGMLKRLRSLFARTDADWIEVDFTQWGSGEVEKEQFALLKQAILQKQVLGFAYAGSLGETSQRRVYPLKLVYKGSAWYLQAFCLSREDYRTFKINRMWGLAIEAETFDREAFHPPAIDSSDGPPPPMAPMTLLFSPSVAYRVYDEFNRRFITRQDDGFLQVKISLPLDQWLYQFLFSFGANLEVLEPAELRDAMAARATNIAKIYKHSET